MTGSWQPDGGDEMKRRRLLVRSCAAVALAAIGVTVAWQLRTLQRDSALRDAIRQDRPEAVKLLLEQGANPNSIGPLRASHASWRAMISRSLGRSQPSNHDVSALGVATGMNLAGELEAGSGHWNPDVISALLAHGAVLNPSDPLHPWGAITGWTLDDNGFGVTYDQRYELPSRALAIGHLYFEKHRGSEIISAFRKAGLKGG
jgi:hypothetical protein